MKDYAAYFPRTFETDPWQVTVTATGFTRIPPHSPYPPGRHPLDHLFTWQRGRILQAYQVIYILDGRGTFESTSLGVREVHPGTALLVFPGIWHRYAPDPNTGWTESWIELQGPAIERLESARVISASRPVLPLGSSLQFAAALNECHELALNRPRYPPGSRPLLAVRGLHVLATLRSVAPTPFAANPSVIEAVRRTQEFLAATLECAVDLQSLAEEFNISYSTLRHAFRQRVGIPPKQYHLQMRLRKAREIIENTDLTLQQIADALGFASSFHLSSIFKRHLGRSPSTFRRGAKID